MTKKNKSQKRLALVENDPWLESAEQNLIDRLNRYNYRLKEIINTYGSLSSFADAHKYFGIHWDKMLKVGILESGPLLHSICFCLVTLMIGIGLHIH